MNQEETKRFPLARVLRIKELKGWAGKDMVVPPGRVGIVIDENGQAKTLPEGTHPVLTFLDRLNGRAARMRFGYILVQPFTTRLDSGYLLSGDGVLMDMSLFASVEIADPGRYFVEQVVPLVEVQEVGVQLNERDQQAVAGALVRKYAAVDLAGTLSTERLAAEAFGPLDAVLQTQGLRLVQVLVLAFWPVEEREKIRQQEAMIRVESEAQLQDFKKQFEQAGNGKSALRLVEAKGGAFANSIESVKAWISNRNKPSFQDSKLFSMLRSNSGTGQKTPPVRHPTNGWWLPGITWIVILLLIGAAMTGLALYLGEGVSRATIYGFITFVWMWIVPFLLKEIKKLVEKQETINEDTWIVAPDTLVDTFVKLRHPEMDQLVRQQCAFELGRTQEILNQVRSKIFKAGNTETALKIRDTERFIDDCRQKVLSQDYGQPPYMGDLEINIMAWNAMIDYDENLMLYASAMSEKALLVQQEVKPGEELDLALPEIEKHLNTFIHQFAGRSRALQIPVQSN